MKLESPHLAITIVITGSSIASSMDTKGTGSKCHEKQDIHMVSKFHSVSYVLIAKKLTLWVHHNQVEI